MCQRAREEIQRAEKGKPVAMKGNVAFVDSSMQCFQMDCWIYFISSFESEEELDLQKGIPVRMFVIRLTCDSYEVRLCIYSRLIKPS